MRLPDDNTKYSSQFKYVELGRFIQDADIFTREKKNGEPALYLLDDVPDYIDKNDRVGLYSSVFQYDGPDISSAACMASMYFDLDAADIEDSTKEAKVLIEYLLTFVPKEALRVYFSGQKGYHLEIEALAVGLSPTDKLPGIFRYIAADIGKQLGLTTLDFKVYDWRRMWRLPETRHQKSGLYKVECMSLWPDGFNVKGVKQWATEARPETVLEQKFDPQVNTWFREYQYRHEQETQKRNKPSGNLDSFLKNGVMIHTFNSEKIFDKQKLFAGCQAVADLDKKARKTHYLNHYERLFLCSLLTYSKEAIEYFEELLGKCEDYNEQISRSHIEDWIKRREYDIGGRPFSCQKAAEVGVVCSSCYNMEPNKKMIQLSDGAYVESEEDSLPSPVRHAYSTKDQDENKGDKKYGNRTRGSSFL